MFQIIRQEAARVIRHLLVPLMLYLVETGRLPEQYSGDLTEAAVLIGSLLVALGWSWARQWREARLARMDPPQ